MWLLFNTFLVYPKEEYKVVQQDDLGVHITVFS